MERFIFNQLIVDSGKDNNNRPILSVYCCHFPDPEITNYDELLELSLKRLNRIVAKEYILVVFTSPLIHSPSLSWMYKAYGSLKRDYKKNIKQLIVVHPSWWFKFIICFMRTVVSSKFAKKVVNVDSIEELDLLINTGEMEIPGDIREYDREEAADREVEMTEEDIEHARQIMVGGHRPRIFGVDLEKAMAPLPGVDPAAVANNEYPEEVKNLIKYVMDKGLRSEGIFRRSPNAAALERLREQMDTHANIKFDEYDVYTLICGLKAYVRELPVPLLDPTTYPKLTDSLIIDESSLPSFVAGNFIRPLDERRRALLRDIMLLSALASQLSGINRMTSRSIAVVWVPNIIRHATAAEDFQCFNASERVVEVMITHYEDVFVRGSSLW